MLTPSIKGALQDISNYIIHHLSVNLCEFLNAPGNCIPDYIEMELLPYTVMVKFTDEELTYLKSLLYERVMDLYAEYCWPENQPEKRIKLVFDH